jgi:transposase-like protein
VLAFHDVPQEHWRQVRSKGLQLRRTDVVGIFPNRDVIVRLVGSVRAEQHDDRAVPRRCMVVER